MTDLDAAGYLRELQEYNRQGLMRTPANPEKTDIFFDSALEHALRALEERAGGKSVEYQKNPNGSYTAVVQN